MPPKAAVAEFATGLISQRTRVALAMAKGQRVARQSTLVRQHAQMRSALRDDVIQSVCL